MHPKAGLLDVRDPGVRDRYGRRLRRALGRRDERAGRRDLEPLRDRMRQDALALADFLDDVSHRDELVWQR